MKCALLEQHYITLCFLQAPKTAAKPASPKVGAAGKKVGKFGEAKPAAPAAPKKKKLW